MEALGENHPRRREFMHPAPFRRGVAVRLTLRRAGVEHSVTRRTNSGLESNLLSDDGSGRILNVCLAPELSPDGASAAVRYFVDHSTVPLEEWGCPEGSDASRSAGTAQVRVGAETLVAGDGKPDGIWVLVERLPIVAPRDVVVREVPDRRTGWLRHAGPTISFLHPPSWKVRQDCGPDLLPRHWHMTDADLPLAKQVDHQMPVSLVAADEASPRAASARAAGGSCVTWRSGEKEDTAYASCAAPGGLTLESKLYLGPQGAALYAKFRRIFESLAFESPASPASAPPQ